MIAVRFQFPGGRYHATPWGKNVNEADVAWPPEPVRILRALIATWWRKGDRAGYPRPMLDALVDVLASEAPVFHLPEAVHAHIRAFMPAPEVKRLIFDGFLKVRPSDQLVAAWPDLVLSPEQECLVQHLLSRLSYLGRAESWVEATLSPDWDGEFNAAPRYAGAQPISGSTPVDLVLSRTPDDWRTERSRQLQAAAGLKGAAGERVRATLPEGLCDALTLDTADWQAAGWSPLPPVLRRLVYDRPEIGPLPKSRHSRRPADPLRQPGCPEIARFVLAGRPLPRVEDTLRIAEVMRAALMSRCPNGLVPPELSGRDADGRPLRADPQHAHAFYLPEDADGDGWIDHLVIYGRLGFSGAARHAFDRLVSLYVERKPSASHTDGSEHEIAGRTEWRVALDQLGPPGEIASSPLVGPSPVWVSATPYLRANFVKARDLTAELQAETYRRAILREWSARFPGSPEPIVDPILREGQHRFVIGVGPRERSTLHFARTRSRGRGGAQPDAMGASLRLSFAEPILGPFAFGKHAHFGMGLFRAPR